MAAAVRCLLAADDGAAPDGAVHEWHHTLSRGLRVAFTNHFTRRIDAR